MPRTKPPPVGDRPAKAARIMAAVYEKKRKQGYSKARSAKMGWGAVRRAGYDPDHFDYDIELLEEIIRDLKAKDEYLDAQAERLGTEYDPAYLTRPVRRGAGLVRRAAGIGRSTYRTAKSLTRRRPKQLPTVTPLRVTPKPKPSRPSYIADPSKLSKPIDLAGYDNLNNVRFVPHDDTKGYYPTRGLVEGQIVLPQNQFLRSLEVIEQNEEYSHIELLDEDGDGFIDRIVARGPKDETRPTRQNVGLFIDIDKPLRTERLAIENWSLAQ